MKTILRFSVLAVLCLAALGLSATNAAAQDAAAKNPCDEADAIAALDGKIRSNYKENPTVEIAIAAAKEYLKRFGECQDYKEFVAWVKQGLPDWEKRDAAYKEYIWRKTRVDKFDAAIQNKKFDEVYAVGAELAQRYPDNITYLLPLGLIGLSESYKNNFKYNDDTIKYAKLALAKFRNGKPEPKKDKEGKTILDVGKKEVFGPYQFERNKEDAISELTYTLGYILYHTKKDKRAGLLYYYEVSQMPGLYKEEPRLYATIGQYYSDESAPIGKEIVDLLNRQKAAATDEERETLDAEIKPKVALYNGYLERSMDAFSRAYKFSDEKIASEKTLKTQVYKALQDIYGRREPPAEFDKWIGSTGSKPLPSPTSEVTPVFDPEPVKATGATPATATPVSGKTGRAKPIAVKGQKPAVKKPRR